MKIAIIGHSGSGKSTLARFLGQHYHCEVVHLDQLHFSSNWQERSDHDMIADLSTCLLKQDWIIEGNYANCLYEERMSEADHIIYVNFSRFHCLYRAFKRYLNYRGKTRPDMANNCQEKFDVAFVKWILLDGRSRNQLKKYQSVVQKNPHKTIVLTNQKQLSHYMNTIN